MEVIRNHQNISIFVFITIIQIYFDKNIYACQTYKGIIVSIIHHFLQIYSIFGSFIFGYHKLHLIALISALLFHVLNGKCFISEIQNNFCNFDENIRLETFLNHLLRMLNIDFQNYIYYNLLLFIIIYDVVYIMSQYM